MHHDINSESNEMEIKKKISSRDGKQKKISEHHHPNCKATAKAGEAIAIAISIIGDVEQFLS